MHQLGGEKAQFVERVLDVRQGQLCWVVGTVYMHMALKPNVLDDISKEVGAHTPHTYIHNRISDKHADNE